MAEEPWSWARRNAYDWVQWGVAHEWSGVAILDLLREIGFGYRMTDLYADIRTIANRTKWEYQVTRLDPTSVVPRSWMSEEPEDIWHVGVPYKAVGYVELYNVGTGEFKRTYASIGLPREMTQQEIYSYVMYDVPWASCRLPHEVLDWETIGMSHLEGAPY